MEQVRAIHEAVAGRGRYAVAGLAGREALARRLEEVLSRDAHILSVSASAVTGRLLVRFNGGSSRRSVAALIDRAVDEARQSLARQGAAGASAKSPGGSPKSSDGPSRSSDGPPRSSGGPPKSPGRLPRSPAGSPKPPAGSPRSSGGPSGGAGPVAALGQETAVAPCAGESPWHRLDAEAALAALCSGRDGLTEAQAAERLARHGRNVLPEPRERSALAMLADQFRSLPSGLLAVAAGLSLATGGVLEAAAIAAVAGVNAWIGYVTESRTQRAIALLSRRARPSAKVLRAGAAREIKAADVAVGDVLALKPGVRVAADARLIESKLLSVDESSLTGESVPAEKRAKTVLEGDPPLADRENMVWMGTIVTGGRALAVVAATGPDTELGRLDALLDRSRPPAPPIERELARTGEQLARLLGGVCAAVFLLGLTRGFGVAQMARLSVSLAAAALPEGLPSAAATTFALGVRRMRRRGVLARKLQAVESMGAVQALCFDKTGTLTRNRMAVREIIAGLTRLPAHDGRVETQASPEARGARKLLEICALCNEAQLNGDDPSQPELTGTPTEIALARLAMASGVDVRALREEQPVTRIDQRSERRLFMRTWHGSPGRKRLLACKGAPGEVLGRCDRIMIGGRARKLTDKTRRDVEELNGELAAQALRVLGVAYEDLAPGREKPETGMVWLGLVAMEDPLREGAAELFAALRQAGVRPVMITGDQNATARAVAERLELSGDEPLRLLNGSVLEDLGDEELAREAKRTHVFSRVSPALKLRIIQAMQADGTVVAMTGDGVNDGPALRAADVGVAMGGCGADVAMEAADVVLEDDVLEALPRAIREGRVIHANIRKSVRFFLSTNMSEVMVLFAAVGVGGAAALSPMQLLWINILSDVAPGLALSMEEAEPDVMERPPRDSGKPLFSRRDWLDMGREGAVISAASLGAWGFGLARYGLGARAGTMAFQTICSAQLLHALTCRSERRGAAGLRGLGSNPALALALGGSFFLQGLTLVVPGLRSLLGAAPLGLLDLAVVAGGSVASLAVNEAVKASRASIA